MSALRLSLSRNLDETLLSYVHEESTEEEECEEMKEDMVAVADDELFTAESENCEALTVIMYEPGIEVFLSCLHPRASLYEKTTTRAAVARSFDCFRGELAKYNVQVHNVRNILQMNREKLFALAAESLKYVYVGEEFPTAEEQIHTYVNDVYKHRVLSDLGSCDLVDVVLTQPIVEFSKCSMNTGIEIEYIKCKPVGNLVFCRDQQITTKKGVVMGRMHSTQRAFERKIMKLVFDNLGINIIGEIPESLHLEGGDFMPINSDLCLLGIGLRTDYAAALHLMEHDLLGTKRIALVMDENDQNQDRMHLDTVFNVLDERNAVVLDFDTVPISGNNNNNNSDNNNQNHNSDISIARTVHVYQRIGNGYELIVKDMDFYEFLEGEGFHLIKVSHEQQLAYMINFLNLGCGNVISVNRDLKSVVDSDHENTLNISYVEFDGIKAMYGAAHCSTQVSRRRRRRPRI